MKGLRSIQPLPPESMRQVVPSKIKGKLPKFEWVDPRTIYVEEAYQRDFAAGGTTLVRKIVGKFSWRRFNPPKCVRLAESGGILVAVDGQHTAIAAATHPEVDKIPVMVVDAESLADRADAFIGQRDRLGLTQMAIHHAAVVAGDPVAAMIERACRKAGASILAQSVNLKRPTKVGETIAVGTIRSLAVKQGEDVLARTLAILVKAQRGPIKAEEISAVYVVLELAGDRPGLDGSLTKVVRARDAAEWSAAAAVRAAKAGRPAPIELAALWLAELGIEADLPKGKGFAVFGAGAGVIARVSAQAKSAAKPPVVVSPPPPPPNPTPPAVPPTIFNGVAIDVGGGKVTHRGITANVEPDGLHLIGLLARVMPALVGPERIGPKIFGNDPDRDVRLRALIERANRQLRAARLEVRQTKNIGVMLADLGG